MNWESNKIKINGNNGGINNINNKYSQAQLSIFPFMNIKDVTSVLLTALGMFISTIVYEFRFRKYPVTETHAEKRLK